MVQLQKTIGDYAEMGYQVFAVAQDTPAENAKVMKKHKLAFPVLSDASLSAAKAFGLVFSVNEQTVERYKGFGLDLVKMYGRDKPEMPVPAIYVFGEGGKVTFSYVNPDYSIRLDSNVLKTVMTTMK